MTAVMWPKALWSMIAATFSEWNEDRVPRMAAALAFYTAFSIAPMLAGALFSVEARLPLLVATIGGLVLLPVLLLAQRAAFARPHGDADSPASVAPEHPVESPVLL